MLEQRCRGKRVFRKKAAKPPPVPRATPRCSPPSAHLRAGLGHLLALPGPRGLPGAGRAVTTGLVTAHAPLSKACSQLPLAAALPPAGTRQGHNWDTAGMGSGRSAAPKHTHGGGCGDKGGAPGPQQHCWAAGLSNRVARSCPPLAAIPHPRVLCPLVCTAPRACSQPHGTAGAWCLPAPSFLTSSSPPGEGAVLGLSTAPVLSRAGFGAGLPPKVQAAGWSAASIPRARLRRIGGGSSPAGRISTPGTSQPAGTPLLSSPGPWCR